MPKDEILDGSTWTDVQPQKWEKAKYLKKLKLLNEHMKNDTDIKKKQKLKNDYKNDLDFIKNKYLSERMILHFKISYLQSHKTNN